MPGGTSAPLDCGPKWQLTAAAPTSWTSRCGGSFPSAATLHPFPHPLSLFFFPLKKVVCCLCIFCCTSYSNFFLTSIWMFCWFSFFFFLLYRVGECFVFTKSAFSKKGWFSQYSFVHLLRLISSQHAPVVKRLFSSCAAEAQLTNLWPTSGTTSTPANQTAFI